MNYEQYNISPLAEQIMQICERSEFPYELDFVFHADYLSTKLPGNFTTLDIRGALDELVIVGLMNQVPFGGHRRSKDAPSLIKSRRDMPYEEFLKTEYWQSVCGIVYARFGGHCATCNSSKMLHVHHRTYENKGDEFNHIGDLTLLCATCHVIIHKLREIK